jgi:hydroxymethylglutaryl-CoA lyase/(R)-citramalyl-CoA lyase
VDPGVVAALAGRFAERAEVVLADTIGVATPSVVRALIERAGADGFHGHNTRNTGYASCLAAVEAGARVLDASVGGLGGCPFSPRATGNVATEDLVHLLEGEGVETGIDLDALIDVSHWLEGLLGRALEGYVYRAGAWPPA